MSTALVIGGSGFIGSHLVDALQAAGRKVRVLGRSPERFRTAPSGVDFIEGSLADPRCVEAAILGVEQVFHLASSTVPSSSNLDPVADITDNLISSVLLLQALRKSDVKKLIYLSSGGTVYGIPDSELIQENHQLRPICSYGVVKVAIENYLHMENHLHGLNYVVLRPSNPYGPRQSNLGVQGVIGTFLWKLWRKVPIEIWGDGSVVRDFVYVKDLAQLCLRAADSDIIGVFNAGSGVGHSIREVLDDIRSVTGIDPAVKMLEARKYDVPRSVLDIGTTQQAFGPYATTPLRDGILETWDWIRSMKNGPS